jgi:hypothetical protein
VCKEDITAFSSAKRVGSPEDRRVASVARHQGQPDHAPAAIIGGEVLVQISKKVDARIRLS